MNEKTPSSVEKFPTEGEVMRVMELLFRGAEFVEIERTEEDGKLNRLIFEGVDSEGDRLLYDYRLVQNTRTILLGDNIAYRTVVSAVMDVVFHDKDGTPCGGYNIADYKQGVWELPQ